jgi:hypothetical protein
LTVLALVLGMEPAWTLVARQKAAGDILQQAVAEIVRKVVGGILLKVVVDIH